MLRALKELLEVMLDEQIPFFLAVLYQGKCTEYHYLDLGGALNLLNLYSMGFSVGGKAGAEPPTGPVSLRAVHRAIGNLCNHDGLTIAICWRPMQGRPRLDHSPDIDCARAEKMSWDGMVEHVESTPYWLAEAESPANSRV